MNTPYNPEAGHSAMNPEDPEQYIRDLEDGGGQPKGAAPHPSNTDSGPRHAASFGEQFVGPGGDPVLGARFRGVAKRAKTPPGRLILACVAIAVFAIGSFLANHAGKTTVHGDLIMINSGARQTIACNNGSLKLDGDNNTYTITGHCRRLEVFGSANHVTVDSADIISAIGDDNTMTYHSGYPTINKTGSNNTVSQRQAPVG